MELTTIMNKLKLTKYSKQKLEQELCKIEIDFPYSVAGQPFELDKEYSFTGKFGTVTVTFYASDFE